MTRPFWFGIAMFSAFGSIYAGLFGLAWLQYPLIALAVLAVVMAFRAPRCRLRRTIRGRRSSCRTLSGSRLDRARRPST